jgi:hypothetical protein
VLSLVIALLLCLRSRHLSGKVQRWSMLIPAAVVVLVNLLHVAPEQPVFGRIAVVLTLALVAGTLLLLLGERLPGNRMRPYWGRATEILETLTAIAVIPLLLQVLHVYELMRGLAG